jgi:hypothetical protein
VDLIDVAAAPAPWTAGGEAHLAGRLTLRGLAALRAFLADAAPGEPMGSAAGVAALLGPGLPLLVWAALHKTEGVTLAEADRLAGSLAESEATALVTILFRRRPGEADAVGLDSDDDDDGDASVSPRWGKLIDQLSEARYLTYDQVLDFTLDQILNAGYRGEPPEPGVRPLSHEEVLAAVAKAREEAMANGTYREPPTAEGRADG